MNVWPAYIDKPISVVAPSTSTVEAYYKLRNNTDDFILIEPEFTYKNANIWETMTQFQIGEYLIKLVVDGVIKDHVSLSVLEQEKVDFTINQKIIDGKITAANSFKVVG